MESHRTFDAEFKEGAVRIVLETGRPHATRRDLHVPRADLRER
jgi:hypothetical protein